MAKAKRVWTDEQRQAARERMIAARAVRWSKPKSDDVPLTTTAISDENSLNDVHFVQIHDIEHNDMPKTLEPQTLPPPRLKVTEYKIIMRNDGTMTSENGPCFCGAGKRAWHRICVNEA